MSELLKQIIHDANSDSIQHICECIPLCTQLIYESQMGMFAKKIIPILNSLSSEQNSERVINTLIDSIPLFCENLINEVLEGQFKNGEIRKFTKECEVIEFVNINIMPILFQFIQFGNINQMKKSMQALSSVCKLFGKDFLLTQLEFFKNMNDKVKPEYYHSLTNFLIDIADDYVTEMYDFIFDSFFKLMNEKHHSIRADAIKVLVAYIGKIDNENEIKFFTECYIELLAGSNVVKTTAVQQFPLFLKNINEKYINQYCTPILSALIEDPSQIVKRILQAKSGELITYFGNQSDPRLIQIYKNSLISQNYEEVYQAAYTFPGVVTSLGRDYFDDFLPYFLSAMNSPNFRVRRTLAFGLVNYAHFFSPEKLEEICIQFLNDQPLVSIGILSNLYQILQFIDNKTSLFFCFQNPLRHHDWRMRKCISEQIRYCFESYDRNDLFQSAIELAKDGVAEVRKDVVVTLSLLIDEDNFGYVDNLSKSDNFWERWIAASIFSICELELAENNLEILFKLCKDPTLNVKIAAANSISVLCKNLVADESKLALLKMNEEIRKDPILEGA
ncbi:HEAT repeat family protein [Tritrichomonas foetus]|uniref:HEAT repeat family protein n=1 Tax=Tritrichomonas foetus TaxID=1144522 RepID=A0A1J4L3C3_9EUKA|nr:HEAT repeat family protein [Tritrichomonas foetus]|eukprot:OHT16454.1 HEAT repeat family protein [Tritrichomonas foetus]